MGWLTSRAKSKRRRQAIFQRIILPTERQALFRRRIAHLEARVCPSAVQLKAWGREVRSIPKYGPRLAGRESMTTIRFETMKDLLHQAELVAMMHSLYSQDGAASPVDLSHFPRNVEQLVGQPTRGRIVLFTAADTLCGYSLLIPYWSNEFGGTLLYVDEIFVVEKVRNHGIATHFFGFLDSERPFDAVALALEVSAGNARARKLYESLGFIQRSNSVLTFRLSDCRDGGNK